MDGKRTPLDGRQLGRFIASLDDVVNDWFCANMGAKKVMRSDTLKRSVTCLKPFVYGRFRRKVTLLRFL